MVAVTPNLSDLALTTAGNTSLTEWVGLSEAIDDEVVVQLNGTGSGSYSYQTAKNSLSSAVYTLPATFDATTYTSPHLYFAMRCDVMPFCELLNTGATNSGLMVRVNSGASNSNYVQWHLAGRDTWNGGWRNFVIDLNNTANIHSTSGTLNLAAISEITFYTDNSNSGNIRIIDNTWLDAVRVGEGLQAESSTTENFNFTNIAQTDAGITTYYGVIQLSDGVLFGAGSLIIGDDTSTATTNFVSDSETLYFKDLPVSSGLYKIQSAQNTGATTNISINSLVSKTVGTSGAELVFTSPINNLSITNSTFISLGTCSFSPSSSNSLAFSGNKFSTCGTTAQGIPATNCEWSGCGLITLTSTLTNCKIIETSDSTKALDTDSLEDMTNCEFTMETGVNTHGVRLTSIGDGSMTWDCVGLGYATGTTSPDSSTPVTPTSNGNELIFVDVASGTLTINVSSTATTPSIRSSGASVIVLAGQVTLTLTGLIADSQANIDLGLPSTEVRIYTAGTTTELDGVENVVETTPGSKVGTFGYTYTYQASTYVDIVVHHIDYDYLKLSNILLGSSDASLPIQQSEDRWYNNP